MKNAHESSRGIRYHALATFSGIVCSFAAIGAALITLRTTFEGIGWGFYMQNPTCVFFILVLFLLCSLHFFGMFSLSIPLPARIKVNSHYIADFLWGAISVVASTVCVGPFSGVSIATALLNENTSISISIFLALGFGLGLPFFAIAIYPKCAKIIPKPGMWLQLFKEFMGYAMLLSCLWPLWILMTQLDAARIIVVLICSILISMFVWARHHSKQFIFFKCIPIAGIAASIVIGAYNTNAIIHISSKKINWEDYSDELFDNLRQKDEAIFLDFTASWCMTCQLNERILHKKSIVSLFRDKNIHAIKCDWTNKNEKITALLKNYNAVAIPLYIYYPGHGEDYIKLPSILTKTALEKILKNEKK
jgi:thiol:disulfide interchange protein DsbD